MKPDQQKPPLSPREGIEGRLKQVFGDVVIERPFVVAHRVFVEPAAPLREGPVKKFLGLTAQSPPLDHREASLEFVLLARDQRSVILRTEHLAECRDVAE